METINVLDNQIYFAKLREDAKIPSKIDENMCYDVYACFNQDNFIIEPHTTAMVPTGICSAFSPKWGISLRERGSTGSIGMKTSAGQIDSGYRGEWFVAVTNTNDKSIVISKEVTKTTETEDYIFYPYSKAICQAKVEEVPALDIVEIDAAILQNIPSKRGVGKLGSSGK